MKFATIEPGIHLVDKQVGETSFSHVQAAKAAAGRRMPLCHAGALDPFASGLLLLLAGPATKLLELIHPAPKTYVATVAWGAETDNGDPLGPVVAAGDASTLTPAVLDDALRPLLGWTEQVPPRHSNKWVDGERAYARAHRGETFELPPSRVYLHAARFVAHDLPRTSVLELVCRGGYYVRSLARDLGRALGCRAHLSALRRTAIGPWRVEQVPSRIDGIGLVPWCASRALTDAELGEVRRGRPIARGSLLAPDWSPPPGFPLEPPPPVRGLHAGKLHALLREEGMLLVAAANLRSGL